MPWTFAHPAAVLPLRRFCPTNLNYAALVIGSMSPDIGYYLNQFGVATYAHSFLGSIFVCIPSGLLIFIAFYALRKPLCHLMPNPHRSTWRQLVVDTIDWNRRRIFSVIVSILIGAWTHILWDSFTHRKGWMVGQLSWLHEKTITAGHVQLPIYHLLQHVSTILGIALIAFTYYNWLKRRGVVSVISTAREDIWRYGSLFVFFMASFGIALALAANSVATLSGDLAIRVFVFKSAIYCMSLLAIFSVVGAIIAYAIRRENKLEDG